LVVARATTKLVLLWMEAAAGAIAAENNNAARNPNVRIVLLQ
jgi:hypothetical protein